MVNNSTNINKMKNNLSLQLINQKKKHDIWSWEFRTWLGTDKTMWQG